MIILNGFATAMVASAFILLGFSDKDFPQMKLFAGIMGFVGTFLFAFSLLSLTSIF